MLPCHFFYVYILFCYFKGFENISSDMLYSYNITSNSSCGYCLQDETFLVFILTERVVVMPVLAIYVQIYVLSVKNYIHVDVTDILELISLILSDFLFINIPLFHDFLAFPVFSHNVESKIYLPLSQTLFTCVLIK